MKDFPERYDKEQLEKMYRELDLPEETVSLLDRYFKSLSYLCGIMPLRDVFNVIDSQNSGLVSREKFLEYAEIVRHEQKSHHYIMDMDELYDDKEAGDVFDRQLVMEALIAVNMDYYYNTAESQKGIPPYIPDKAELLKYENEYYYESSPQSEAMIEFMNKKTSDSRLAKDIIFDFICAMDDPGSNPYEDALSNAHKLSNIDFTDEEIPEFIKLFTELFKNMRLKRFCGHTAAEVQEITGRPVPEYPMPDYEKIKSEMTYSEMFSPLKKMITNYQSNGDGTYRKRKIGRNEPCPCGSGKKYKKCCML